MFMEGGNRMTDVEMICFKMISSLGAARSCFMEAMQMAKKYNFLEAKRLLEEGEGHRIEGHEVHFELLSKESSGANVSISLLLLHAEDQLMSAELLKVVAEETLENYRKFQQLEQYNKEGFK